MNAGPLDSSEVAERSGCAERYVREWLNSQAAAGYVIYHPTSATYELTPEQSLVLAEDDSPVFMPPAWEVPVSMFFDEEKTMNAFRTGIGVAWDEHNDRLFCGVAAFYRNAYRNNLVREWLPALRGVEEKLRAGAKVADVGCGHGHSTILMAEAFPKSRFWGFDYHDKSIDSARSSAQNREIENRLKFEVANATSYRAEGFDLICFFDCLHDIGDPIAAARHAKRALADDGTDAGRALRPRSRRRKLEHRRPSLLLGFDNALLRSRAVGGRRRRPRCSGRRGVPGQSLQRGRLR
jgi:SAM-dependent methyltransferase